MNTNYFVTYLFNVSYFIEDGSIILNISSYNILVSTVCDNFNSIAFPCEMLTLYRFHELCYCFWFFSSNYQDTYIRFFSIKEITVLHELFFVDWYIQDMW